MSFPTISNRGLIDRMEFYGFVFDKKIGDHLIYTHPKDQKRVSYEVRPPTHHQHTAPSEITKMARRVNKTVGEFMLATPEFEVWREQRIKDVASKGGNVLTGPDPTEPVQDPIPETGLADLVKAVQKENPDLLTGDRTFGGIFHDTGTDDSYIGDDEFHPVTPPGMAHPQRRGEETRGQILTILQHHPGTWMSPKQIAHKTAAINYGRVSSMLPRMHEQGMIERNGDRPQYRWTTAFGMKAVTQAIVASAPKVDDEPVVTGETSEEILTALSELIFTEGIPIKFVEDYLAWKTLTEDLIRKVTGK